MRKKIETIKAGISLVIFFASVSAMNSDYYIAIGIIAMLSLLYFTVCAKRIGVVKR